MRQKFWYIERLSISVDVASNSGGLSFTHTMNVKGTLADVPDFHLLLAWAIQGIKYR